MTGGCHVTLSCDVTVWSCDVTVWSCDVTVWSCDVAVWSCDITMHPYRAVHKEDIQLIKKAAKKETMDTKGRGIKAEGRKRGPPEHGLSLSFVHGYVLVHVSCSDCPIWKLIDAFNSSQNYLSNDVLRYKFCNSINFNRLYSLALSPKFSCFESP